MSRNKIQQAIAAGHVQVNGNVVRDANYKVKIGDAVDIEIVPSAPLAVNPDASVPFEILYEDNDLIVIDKPAGVVVHPGAGNHEHTLVNGLAYHCDLSSGSDDCRPGIVHRIDKDTSGILVIAKNDFAHAALAEQFSVHSISRKYICFCYGIPQPKNNKIETYISRDKKNRLKMAISDSQGKFAVTIYRTLRTYGNFAAKVECELQTGRTHQIRAHMSHLNHPLIGDNTYCTRLYSLPKNITDEVRHFPRQALHAHHLGFVHPTTAERMEFNSPLPQDLKNLEKILESV